MQPNNSTLTGSVLEWEKVEEVDVCGDGGGGGGGKVYNKSTTKLKNETNTVPFLSLDTLLCFCSRCT